MRQRRDQLSLRVMILSVSSLCDRIRNQGLFVRTIPFLRRLTPGALINER
jgi:hypothetical protein